MCINRDISPLFASKESQLAHIPSPPRFNKITIQATAQMAADKEAIGLSRVHVEGPTNLGPKCNLPLRFFWGIPSPVPQFPEQKTVDCPKCVLIKSLLSLHDESESIFYQFGTIDTADITDGTITESGPAVRRISECPPFIPANIFVR